MEKLFCLLYAILAAVLFVMPVSAQPETDPAALCEDIFNDLSFVGDDGNGLAESEEEVFYADGETSRDAAPKLLYGDVNKDGTVTASDARTVLRFSAKLIRMNALMCAVADANQSLNVDAEDARLILRAAAGLESLGYCTAAGADENKMCASYDLRKVYKPTVSGFKTNINDSTVFAKIKELENYCKNLGSHLTFMYTDVTGRYYISYKAGTIFRTQCTIKAPYVKTVLVYMEEHNISLDKKLTMTSWERNRWSGHYVSANYSAGTRFTIRELIRFAIRISDNTAYQILFDNFGTKIFNDNAKKIGASLRLDSYIFGETSASDMAKFFVDIYNYNGKYKNFLYTEMRNTRTNDLIGGGLPEGQDFIRKWGSGGSYTKGWHDCVCVFTETPYVLVIYTDFNQTRNYDKIPFRKVSSYVYGINRKTHY